MKVEDACACLLLRHSPSFFLPDELEICAVVVDGLALPALLDLHPARLHHRRLGALPLAVARHAAPRLHVTHSALKQTAIYHHSSG